MNLPIITIPVQIPDVIPLLLHPVAVHFTVVLPLVILVLELINLITKRKALTITIYLLFVMLLTVFAAAYATGVTDGGEAGPLLSEEGLAALKSHKLLGVYLIYLSVVPILLKMLTLLIKKPWVKIVYFLSFIGIISLTMFQAKAGGELVYNYGANVSSQLVLEDKIEELEDELEELQSNYEEQIKGLKSELEKSKQNLSDTSIPVVQPVMPETINSNVEPIDSNDSATSLMADGNSSL